MLQYEKKYWQSGKKYLAGIDEAGRGPLAGPVAAAAVILPENVDLPEVTDSRKSVKKNVNVYLMRFIKLPCRLGWAWFMKR